MISIFPVREPFDQQTQWTEWDDVNSIEPDAKAANRLS